MGSGKELGKGSSNVAGVRSDKEVDNEEELVRQQKQKECQTIKKQLQQMKTQEYDLTDEWDGKTQEEGLTGEQKMDKNQARKTGWQNGKRADWTTRLV